MSTFFGELAKKALERDPTIVEKLMEDACKRAVGSFLFMLDGIPQHTAIPQVLTALRSQIALDFLRRGAKSSNQWYDRYCEATGIPRRDTYDIELISGLEAYHAVSLDRNRLDLVKHLEPKLESSKYLNVLTKEFITNVSNIAYLIRNKIVVDKDIYRIYTAVCNMVNFDPAYKQTFEFLRTYCGSDINDINLGYAMDSVSIVDEKTLNYKVRVLVDGEVVNVGFLENELIDDIGCYRCPCMANDSSVVNCLSNQDIKYDPMITHMMNNIHNMSSSYNQHIGLHNAGVDEFQQSPGQVIDSLKKMRDENGSTIINRGNVTETELSYDDHGDYNEETNMVLAKMLGE